MNGDTQPHGLWAGLTHEQALALSLESIDIWLEPADAALLGDHLDSCSECAAIDAENRAIHEELHGLAMPEVPRDLWARTSAGLDAVDRTQPGLTPSRVKQILTANVPLLSTAAAAGLVIVLVTATMFLGNPGTTARPTGSNGGNVAAGSGASGLEPSSPPGPLAVVGGTSYWISENSGVYEIKVGSGNCPAGQAGCNVSGGGQTLGSVQSKTPVSAAIAPDASRAAVWNDAKIAVLTLVAQPATVPLDLLTPRPAAAATATPAPTQEPVLSPASDTSSEPTAVPATPSATPAETAAALNDTSPVAILSGYEIIGLDPEFSADGLTLAFTARPKDHSAGPDVFVWRVGQARAHAVTLRHADQLAGWYGDHLLISEFSDATVPAGSATPGYASYVFDPRTETTERIDRPMLLPSIDPSGTSLVYWAGTVAFDRTSGLWLAASGDLYFDSWSNLTLSPAAFGPAAPPAESAAPVLTAPDGSPEPSEAPTDSPAAVPTEAQHGSTARILDAAADPGTVHDWVVRWDASGRHAAIWVAEPGKSDIGRLSLFSIDRAAGRADADQPLPQSDRVTNGLAFDDGHIVYTSADGKTYVQDIAALAPITVASPTPAITVAPSDPPAPPALQSPDAVGG
jgi:hypothetical protein